MDTKSIYGESCAVIRELLSSASVHEGDIVIVGCSTSEIGGHLIGTASNEEIAKAVMDAFLPELQKKGAYLAAQCCEHLNRAIVIEREAMRSYSLDEVNVIPWLHAGGAFAVEALGRFEHPVVVENILASAIAGIDVGGTFIGMHIKPVVVPIHSTNKKIGMAHVMMARSRPKYVGGPRAQYPEQRAH